MNPIILNWQQIEPLLKQINVFEPMKQGFIKYSQGLAEIPPVGELIMNDPPGDVHIKYGYIKGGKYYVIKIASGFSGNNELGIKPGQGMMLLFNLSTGQTEAILIDDANLTDIRTGIAGAIVSQELACNDITDALIVGTGVQARYQAKFLCDLMPIEKLYIWGRDINKANKVKDDLSELNVELAVSSDLSSLVRGSRLIITTTSSKEPIIQSDWIQPGTHITAVGSDTLEKCELDYKILAEADVIVADSIEQNLLRGEIHQAIKHHAINKSQLIEIGQIFDSAKKGRTSANDISIADLTGVAIQDLVIAEAVLEASKDQELS
ncbi:MAG: ornithine cyclodeaminase family protein [Pseudomonadota bacterium]|nr:ornithine cyclodeaminase family protein [Pseudomonadota bacterium]